MNSLSNDLTRLEVEIDYYKNQAGLSIWEIGSRLNYIKQNILTRGEFKPWLKERNIQYTAAVRMMKVARELSPEKASANLGVTALYLIASLPEEAREESYSLTGGEVKQPNEMTVQELRKLHGDLNSPESEKKIIEEKENQGLLSEISSLKEQLKNSQELYNQLKSDYQTTLSQIDENKSDTNTLNKLKNDIDRLTSKKDIYTSQIDSLKNVLRLKEQVQVLLSSVSPLFFEADVDLILANKVVKDNLFDLIDQVQNWCDGMYKKFKQPNIINAQVINVDND